jgi:hypothetical protein
MTRVILVALGLAAMVVAACTSVADGSATAVPTYWPAGVATPPPPLGAPVVSTSEVGRDLLQIAFEPPHLHFSLKALPQDAFSVIYVVQSTRDKYDRLQIDSVTPESNFKAMLEYDRLVSGEYTVSAYVKDGKEPLDVVKIQVP